MITDWRTRWNEGDFPFLIVHLANFMPRTSTPVEGGWAELREAQALTTTALPNVGLASAIDIGDAADIHPRNKQDVGRRLGLAARAIAYKQKLAYSGPVFKSMAVKDGKAELNVRAHRRRAAGKRRHAQRLRHLRQRPEIRVGAGENRRQ